MTGDDKTTFRCPECGATVEAAGPGEEQLCPECGKSVRSEAPDASGRPSAAPAPGARSDERFPAAIAAGLAAAIVGGLVWLLIIVVSDRELGILAWGIGAVVGFAVILATPERSRRTGVLASALAVAGIVAGKLLVAQFYDIVPALAEELKNSQEFVVPDVADVAKELMDSDEFILGKLAREKVDAGEVSPKLAAWFESEGESEPPQDCLAEWQAVCNAVAARNQAMSAEEKRDMCRRAAEEIVETMPRRAAEEIVASMSYLDRLEAHFSFYDLLWLVLAVASAWRIGSVGSLRRKA